MKEEHLNLQNKILLGLFVVMACFLFACSVNAEMNKFDPGSSIIIGEFVYDDDYVATTTDCTISIYNPAGDLVTPGVLMSTSTNGWHYYSTTTLSTEGVWPTSMTCGSADRGDLASIDKTFVVGYVSASSTVISDAVWNNSATSSIATIVNVHTDSALNTASSSITSVINAHTDSALQTATSSLASVINANTNQQIAIASSSIVSQLASYITNIPALVWSYISDAGRLATNVWGGATRTLTSALLGNGGSLATESYVDTATSSITTSITTASSSVASVINTSIKTASSSIVSEFNSAIAVNNAMIQTLDDTNAVWDYLGQVLHSGQSGTWATSLSDVDTIVAGKNLREKVYVTNQWNAADASSAPVIKIYDPNRNLVAGTPASMSRISAGIYEFTSYTIPADATPGIWETIVDTVVPTGTIETSDYWTVEAPVSPPKVNINGIEDNIIPDIMATSTIKNEGPVAAEYQYEWCVIANVTDGCESNPVSYGGLTSQRLTSGQIIHPDLPALSIPTAGTYYFKLVVYYGGDQTSNSIYPFTAVAASTNPPVNPPPSGGGGGGGVATGILSQITTTKYKSSDFNRDGKVNSIDFSILLYYWKSKAPFSNKYVDINKDGKVDSVDFSILLYEWGSK